MQSRPSPFFRAARSQKKMKTALIFAIALAVLGAYAVSLRHAIAQSSTCSTATEKQSPFYCIRTALNPEQLQRKAELSMLLRSSRRNTREVSDGYEFELPASASTIQAAAEWAALERLCCPFFDIELRLGPKNGPLVLRLTGREGVKQFIHSEFSPWFQEAL
jgi:hypothetical protein